MISSVVHYCVVTFMISSVVHDCVVKELADDIIMYKKYALKTIENTEAFGSEFLENHENVY